MSSDEQMPRFQAGDRTPAGVVVRGDEVRLGDVILGQCCPGDETEIRLYADRHIVDKIAPLKLTPDVTGVSVEWAQGDQQYGTMFELDQLVLVTRGLRHLRT